MKQILIVVDMQNDFISGSLGTKEAQGIVEAATEKIKNFNGDIFVTYDTHFENYMDTSEGKNLPVPHCIKGTKGWELNERIEEVLSEKKCQRIEKLTFGSVKLPQLINKLYGNEKIEIELIGLCTDICVVSNALILKANFPENLIKVDASCCAGVTPDTHNFALDTMKMCQIVIENRK